MEPPTEAMSHELLGGVFGWVWIIATLGVVVTLVWAIFGNLSLWWPIGLFAGGAFFKAVTRDYIKSRNEAMIRHEIASKHKAAKDSQE
jgi:hypothetical protein